MKIFAHPKVQDVKIVEFEPKGDSRGHLTRVLDRRVLADQGFVHEWVQENEVVSVPKGVLRGLHFQWPPHAESKFVRCVAGEILDVGVDLRDGSPTFGHYVAEVLREGDGRALVFPRGFAHGYLTRHENSVVRYAVDNYYTPGAEDGVLWNDPTFSIDWGISTPILSEKDQAWPDFEPSRHAIPTGSDQP